MPMCICRKNILLHLLENIEIYEITILSCFVTRLLTYVINTNKLRVAM